MVAVKQKSNRGTEPVRLAIEADKEKILSCLSSRVLVSST